MESNNECGSPLLVDRLLTKLREDNTSLDPATVQFKSESCFFLGLLSRNGTFLICTYLTEAEYSREIIIGAGGLDFILRQIKDPSSSLVALRYCCYAIGNLATSLSGTF
jgi:hypothetical protein